MQYKRGDRVVTTNGTKAAVVGFAREVRGYGGKWLYNEYRVQFDNGTQATMPENYLMSEME